MSYEAWGEPDDEYMTADQAIDAGWLSPDSYSKGAMDVLNERIRHVSEEGWSEEHDDAHRHGEMADAAALYASRSARHFLGAKLWPWAPGWFKPTSYRRDLVKAAALIIAEIDRLDRAEERAKAEGRP